MNDFRLRPAAAAEPPRYPAAPAPGEPPKPPMISNRVSRFAPLLFLAAGGSLAFASRSAPAVQEQRDARVQEPPEGDRRPVARLSDAEVDVLIGRVLEQQAEAPEMRGGRAPAASSILTEAEVRKLLEAMLRKNGLTAAATRLRRPGVDVEADAWDPARKLGVEILGAAEGCRREFRAAESDLSDEEREELELLRARGELRLLVLDGRAYEYEKDVMYRGMATRSAAVHRLLAEIERFVEEVRE